MARSLVCAVAAAALLGSALSQEDFDWAALTPTTDLRYTDCYDGFRCARLQVPMDWHNASDQRTVAIAIAVLPAQVPPQDPSYGGTVVVNPGGPGGSGVTYLLESGRHIQYVLDRNKKYEILSFDPRGVGYTTPRLDCFSDELARGAYALSNRAIGPLDAGLVALKQHVALYNSINTLCDAAIGSTGIEEHISTAAVARDMVEMIDRTQDLRKKEKALRRRDNGTDTGANCTGPARLQYIGFSYGTFLGNTFAAMFPGRVGRIVIDGVVDAPDYANGQWAHNLDDAEAVVNFFYDACFELGDACAIRTPQDTKGADMRVRIDQFIAELDANPVSLVQGHSIQVITGGDIRTAFAGAVYQPIALFPIQAQLLADAMVGNFTLLTLLAGISPLEESCALTNSTPHEAFEDDSTRGIACTDADGTFPKDAASRLAHVYMLNNQSSTLGPTWSRIPVECSTHKPKAAWRFGGPWSSPPASLQLTRGKPAAPLLLLSNRLDPVTPVASALRMSAGHPGSAVVIQESAGHCALQSGWSECTNAIVRDYFEHGTMPKNGTICTTACKPWQQDDCGLGLQTGSQVAARALTAAPWRMRSALRPRLLPLGV